jgi:acyl carrier protein
MDNEFRSGLAEALQMPEAAITEDTELGETWDSVAVITAISLIDHHYNVTVSASELEECKNVGDLLRLADRRE